MGHELKATDKLNKLSVNHLVFCISSFLIAVIHSEIGFL